MPLGGVRVGSSARSFGGAGPAALPLKRAGPEGIAPELPAGGPLRPSVGIARLPGDRRRSVDDSPVKPYTLAAIAIVLAAALGEAFGHLRDRADRHMKKVRTVYIAVGIVGLVVAASWASAEASRPDAVTSPLAEPAPPPGVNDVVPVPGARGGWGPGTRLTYTLAEPPDKAVLNSITDNKTFGDERNLVQVRNLTTDSQFAEDAEVCRGQHAEWFVLVASDASAGLGDAGTVRGLGYRALAGDLDTSTPVTVVLSSTNAGEVWDSADVHCGGRAITLRFLPGTARMISNGTSAAGMFVGGDPFQGTVPIGAERADGTFPAGKLSNGQDGGIGYITFQTLVL